MSQKSTNGRPTPQTANALEPRQASALAEFSAALGKRFPDRMIRRFVMPARIRECREIFVIELTSNEEIEAGVIADAVASKVQRSSMRMMMECERREAIKLSIVGVGQTLGGSVAYRHTNLDGIPFGDPTAWSLPAWAALQTYFGEVNGIPTSELEEGKEGAMIVGAFAPPITAIPASADSGKSDASSGANT